MCEMKIAHRSDKTHTEINSGMRSIELHIHRVFLVVMGFIGSWPLSWNGRVAKSQIPIDCKDL